MCRAVGRCAPQQVASGKAPLDRGVVAAPVRNGGRGGAAAWCSAGPVAPDLERVCGL